VRWRPPRFLALLPLANLYLWLWWNGAVSLAVERGDCYLLSPDARWRLVFLFGFGPVLLLGALILMHLLSRRDVVG